MRNTILSRKTSLRANYFHFKIFHWFQSLSAVSPEMSWSFTTYFDLSTPLKSKATTSKITPLSSRNNGLIPMNRTVVLLIPCFFREILLQNDSLQINVSVMGLFGGHVLVVSSVTCGISIIYRTSKERSTQTKDIFQLLNALLSVELNVRHYASNFILFQLK